MPYRSSRQRRHRTPPKQHGRATVLVLCEGHRTEPGYLTDMRKTLHLTGVRIVSTLHEGLAGVGKKLAISIKEGAPDDEYWCVVDHDERKVEFEKFLTQVEKLQNLRSRPRIHVIVSRPCFEYWFLLHFEDTTRPFRGSPGGDSACNQVISKLQRHLPNYRKNDRRLFLRLQKHLPVAIKQAKRNRTEGSSSTDVWRLVERLRTLADPVHSSGVGPRGR